MSDQQHNLFSTEPQPWELDDAEEQCVASIVFAEPPYGPYDYAVPLDMQTKIEPGRRVKTTLGRGNRTIIGYCVQVEFRASQRKLKELKDVVDDFSLLSPAMLRLTKWMAEYYLSPWGVTIEAVVPAGVRGQAGTREMTFLSVPIHVVAKLTQLKLGVKQKQALEILAASPRPLTTAQLAAAADCTTAPISQLRKKGLVQAETRRVQQAEHDIAIESPTQAHALNDDQQKSLDAIVNTLKSGEHETMVLHGVTGSGKTEVYIRAIEEVLKYRRQAIVLVPEISLTPQTRQRFRSRFERVAVLHSHLSPAERHWHWKQIAQGKIDVIVGARSAIFAPTPHLGLIVLDEEHDSSFKQDSAPRYHARDVAEFRAREESLPLVLGTATPSLESWRKARNREYRLLSMPTRIDDRPMPDVGAIDLRAEFHDKSVRGALSRPLLLAIKRALDDQGQVILLLNRRGYSTNIQCPACGHVVKCNDCDIALTHHREGDEARCHYCDYVQAAPPVCPECQFDGIRYAGFGTQRLEAEVQGRFPHESVLRMDSDSMKKHGSHEAALDRFRKGEVKILLGTQMIAKGLDFPNVTLVGVVNADTSLHFPDFRAAERTFQLVTQVAGRTGRGERGGRVLVQTFSPDHYALEAAFRHDYEMFADRELPSREEFGYPPFEKMIRLIVRGPDEEGTEQYAEQLADQLRDYADAKEYEARVLGPAPAPLSRLRGKFRFHALLQGPRGKQLRDIATVVSKKWEAPDEIQWVLDVDPLSLL